MNPLLKKKATSRQGIEDEINYIYTIADDPATPKEEAQQLLSRIPALQQELKSNGWDTPPSNEEFTSLQERGWLPDDESLRSGDAQIADMADDLRGSVTHEKTPNALDKRWMKSVGIQAKKSPLLQKKATIGQFGIDYHLREDMENSTPHTVGQPSAYAEKGTEEPTTAPNPLVASAHFACAQCKKAFVEPTDLATHAEESKHNVWDDDPIKEEVEDANFFKESEDEVPVADPNPDPFAKALKSLEELAITTTDDDVRECCKLAIEDLRYFREGHPPAQSDKVAATKSYGGTPAHPTPLGGTANPTAVPVPAAPTTPSPTPSTPPVGAKPNTPPPVVGQPLTQDQVNTLQQTAAVDMHPTPKDKPPSNFRGHLDEDIKNDIKKKINAPVMHRIGGEDSGCEIKEVLSPCPNCRKTNTQVVDEEDEDKLMECRDCGSFFTV